jgi:hypothetical protein
VSEATYSNSVFINCPFDEDFEPILQAILFCVVFLGLHPRIATERSDSAEARLEKIVALVESCQFSIHDLSRAQASSLGELFRLNMPFELGIDWGCRRWSAPERSDKRFLILEERQYRYRATLSDLSGSDIQSHGGNFDTAVRKVRNWLVSEVGVIAPGATRVLARYADFQGWYFDKQLAAGFSEEDIKDYPTRELLEAMFQWMELNQPVAFS